MAHKVVEHTPQLINNDEQISLTTRNVCIYTNAYLFFDAKYPKEMINVQLAIYDDLILGENIK